VPIHRRWTA